MPDELDRHDELDRIDELDSQFAAIMSMIDGKPTKTLAIYFDENFDLLINICENLASIHDEGIPQKFSSELMEILQKLWDVTEEARNQFSLIRTHRSYFKIPDILREKLENIHTGSPDIIGTLPYIRKRLRALIDENSETLSALKQAGVLTELETGLEELIYNILKLVSTYEEIKNLIHFC